MRVQCEHLSGYEIDEGGLEFDINVRITGERDVLALCGECYNRLIGQIIRDTLDVAVHHVGSQLALQLKINARQR